MVTENLRCIAGQAVLFFQPVKIRQVLGLTKSLAEKVTQQHSQKILCEGAVVT